MRPGPALASRHILDGTELDAPPRPLVEILQDLALDDGWASSSAEAREKAESWHDATLSRLRVEVNRLAEMGRPVRIGFNSSSAYLIQGACFPEPYESDVVKEMKQRRLASDQYFSLFSKLSPYQFEQLCGKLLELLGVSKPTVTRASADEGIDFYGVLELDSVFFPNDLQPTIQKQLRIWLVGQAKHHQLIQSGTNEIRDLAGAVTLGRARAFGSKIPPYQDLHIRVADPVFEILITTGSLSSNAWRLLERSGVIGVDGEMLAAFLADRGVGMHEGEFDSDAFHVWLQEEP